MNGQTFLKKMNTIIAVVFLGLLTEPSFGQTGSWSYVEQAKLPTAREECSLGQAGGKFYLIGGRGIQFVEEYNPANKTWKPMAKTPVEMNHFQAISYAGLIYVICAMNGSYPHEVPVPNIYIYDPLADIWIKGAAIPTTRLRGSAGNTIYQDKFYVALGIQDGHSSGWVPYLDKYDPATGLWKILPDAPRARDHFQTANVNGKIFALGGRRSNFKPDNVKVDIFADLEKVDVFDIAKGTWSTLPSPVSDLKLKRSGSAVVALGDEIIVAGGGSVLKTDSAHSETDALNTITGTWRSLARLNRGRQVMGGVLNNQGIYLASGSGGPGGSPTLQTTEVFFLGATQAPSGDALIAGQIASTETPFNLGMVATGAKFSRTIGLRHVSGNQGVLVGNIQVSGNLGFKILNAPAFPVLVRPGGTLNLEIEFTASVGTAVGTGVAGSLDVTLEIPKTPLLKIPLEANSRALTIQDLTRGAVAPTKTAAGFEKQGWLLEAFGHANNVKGQTLP
jgi:large repetitive protein